MIYSKEEMEHLRELVDEGITSWEEIHGLLPREVRKLYLISSYDE